MWKWGQETHWIQGMKVVLVEAGDRTMEKEIQKVYKDRFPDLADIKEDFEIIEQVTKTRSERADNLTKKTVVKITHDNTEQDISTKLIKLKEELGSTEGVAMHQVNCINNRTLRKMFQCILHGSEIYVKLYTSGKERANAIVQADKVAQRKDRPTYAIMVEDGGVDYRTLLNSVKTQFASNPAKKAIRSIRSTKEGKLLITTDKDIEAIGELQKVIQAASTTINVKQAGTRQVKKHSLYQRH